MRTRDRALSVVVAAVALGALAGCNGGSSAASPTTVTVTVTASPTEQPVDAAGGEGSDLGVAALPSGLQNDTAAHAVEAFYTLLFSGDYGEACGLLDYSMQQFVATSGMACPVFLSQMYSEKRAAAFLAAGVHADESRIEVRGSIAELHSDAIAPVPNPQDGSTWRIDDEIEHYGGLVQNGELWFITVDPGPSSLPERASP